MNAHSSSHRYSVSALPARGERYEAEVPGTLDLAERARYSLNVLTRATVPGPWYGIWQGMNLDSNPPFFSWPNYECAFIWTEALPRMRLMCGDDLNLDTEQAMMQAFVDRIGAHGLYYYPPISPSQPPDTAYGPGSGRLMLAMGAWHERDGDPIWVDLIQNMAQGLAEAAIHRYHYAYYPLESGWARDGSWQFTRRAAGRPPYFPYTPPDEPARDQQGHEGTVKWDMATPARGLVKAYHLTGDESCLELARRLIDFCLLPSMWEDGWEYGIAGHEHGLFGGHFYGNVGSVRGLLDVAIAVGDAKIKGIVREAYDHGRRVGLAHTGWVPGWVTPERYGRLGDLATWVRTGAETCGIADMIGLAIDLSDAGIGDYWDDVDHFVRNQLVEQQLIDADRLGAISDYAISAKLRHEPDVNWTPAGLKATENVIERSIGCFVGAGTPSAVKPVVGAGCCTGNGSLALHRAWEGSMRYADGLVTVNLLWNRASPWADMNSWLPYDGRVQIANKVAEAIAVRVPGWAGLEKTSLLVDGSQTSPRRVGRYLVVEGLRPGQLVELRFDVPEQRADYILHGCPYSLAFRGSTVVDVSPRDESPLSYPLYRREEMKAGGAPMKKVERFAARIP